MAVRIDMSMTAIALLASCVAAEAQYRPYEPAWNVPATPHKVVGNVYFVGTTELGTFLITTRDGHILLDPGFEESVPLIKNAMRTLSFKYEDIKVLLTSQAHYDHAAGLATIKRETGARLEVMGPDAELLSSGGKTDFLFGADGLFRPVKADRLLKDGDAVEQGGVRLVARHTPGHTKGATTFVTAVQDGGRAYQVVFAVSTTVNPGTSLIDNPKYPDIIEDWQRTYAILETLVGDVWVAAHSRVFDMAGKLSRIGKSTQNPYVDPQGYRRYIANGRQRFGTLLAEQIKGAR